MFMPYLDVLYWDLLAGEQERAGSSAVAMLASQARGRGFKSRPVHTFLLSGCGGDFEFK
jgi:hypothetical protein